MPSPFPGMDPHLEHPARWHPVHTRIVTGIADALEPLLPPRYYVSVEERAAIGALHGEHRERVPDVAVVDIEPTQREFGAGGAPVVTGVSVTLPMPDEIRERYLEIRDLEQGERIVTIIEVLSPANKRPGDGRDAYITKRGAVLASLTNLVEVDLLRMWPRMPVADAPLGYDYSILVSRAQDRPAARLIPFTIRDPLPHLPVPLHPGDMEPVVDLGAVLAHVYERGRYARRIDYRDEPEPPLPPEDASWADTLLREKGLR